MRVRVKFTGISKHIPVKFKKSVQRIKVNFGTIQNVTEYIGGEQYTGEYVVTPKVEEQTIPTKDKVLVEDMTIKAIPFFNVSNASGGSTVYIGSEV